MNPGRTAGRGTILFGWIKIILVLIAFYIVLVFTLHRLAEGLIEEQLVAINSGLAAQIRSRMDNRLTETRAIGMEVANAPYASALPGFQAKDPAEYSWAYRDMVEYFRVTEATHTYIEAISILYIQNGSVITSDGFFSMTDEELPEGILDLAAGFAEEAADRPGWNRFDWFSLGYGNFFYIQLLSDALPQRDTPVLLVSFDEKDESASLKEIPVKYGGVQYITDAEGTILFSSGGAALPADLMTGKIAGPRSEIIRGTGAFAAADTELAGLVCCSFIPEELYMSELHRLRRIFLTVAAAAVILCFALAGYFFAVHYRPIRKIIDGLEGSLEPAGERKNEYERLEAYSNRLLSANRINREQLRRFEEAMDARRLEQLLKGTIPYRTLPAHMKISGPPGGSKPLHLVCLKLAGSDFPSEVTPLYVSEVLAALPAGWKGYYEVYIDEAAVLLLAAEDGKTPDKLAAFLEKKGESMTGRTGYTPLAVIGPPFAAPEDIPAMYRLCRRRMEETEFFMQERTVFAGPEEAGGFLCLDREDQDRLSAALREGSYEKAAGRIRIIMQHITSKTGAGADAARCLLFSTLTTVVQTVSSTPAGTGDFMTSCNSMIARFFSSDDIRTMEETLDTIVKTACREISGKKRDHTRRLFEEIKSFVDIHLADKDMYLPSVAAHFGMNPKYLTVFFRENQGIPLAEYIRRERVNRACSLILQGKPVKLAAEESGFSNIISFNRVFKGIKKMTPTEFRREAAMKKNIYNSD